jgi:hypothetical protein
MILVLFLKMAVKPKASLVKTCLGIFVISSMGNIVTAACSKNF